MESSPPKKVEKYRPPTEAREEAVRSWRLVNERAWTPLYHNLGSVRLRTGKSMSSQSRRDGM